MTDNTAHYLSSPPLTPAVLVPTDLLDRLESRITALEAQNASFTAHIRSQLHETTLPSPLSASGDISSSPPIPNAFRIPSTPPLDCSVPPSPRTPSSSRHHSVQSQAQSAADRKCFALSARVQSLQDELNQCVDACSSALDLERSLRAEIEQDNCRLAEENQILRQDKETLEREVRWLKGKTVAFREDDVHHSHHRHDVQQEEDRAVAPLKRAKKDLRISTCSNITDITLVESEIPSDAPDLRLSKRSSWLMSALKAQSLAVVDFSNSLHAIIQKDPDKTPVADEVADVAIPSQATSDSLATVVEDDSTTSHEFNSTVAKLSSLAMQKAVRRASTLVTDVVRAYGQQPIAEGVVL